MSLPLKVPETGFNYIKKRFRSLSYLSFLVGSIFGLVYPSTTIRDLTSVEVSLSWSLIFALSSATCFLGVALGNWVVEYFGLPSLTAVFLVFGSCCFITAFVNDQYNFVMFGMIFVGISAHLLFRFLELKNYLKRKPIQTKHRISK